MQDLILYWVGPRLSDILGNEKLFKGAVVLLGSEENDNLEVYSYEKFSNKRINHNDVNSLLKTQDYIESTLLNILNKNPNAYFMFYNDLSVPNNERLIKRSFLNDYTLINLLSDKYKIRNLFALDVDVINSKIFFTKDINYKYLKEKYNEDKFIIQTIQGAGGNTTFVLASEEDDTTLTRITDIECMVSIFLQEAIPVNVHVCLDKDFIQFFPPSIQIVEHKNNNLLYSGADFIAFSKYIEKPIQKKLLEKVEVITKKISSFGYKGVLGIDFLIQNNDIYFVEINPRFQASTFLLNQYLESKQLPTIQELQLNIYRQTPIKDLEINFFEQINKSFFSILYSEDISDFSLNNNNISFLSPDTRNSDFNKSKINIEIVNNDIINKNNIERNSNFAYFISDFPLVYKSFITKEFELIEQLKRIFTSKTKKFVGLKNSDKEKIALLKFELLTYGAQISETAKRQLYKQREFLTIRDGVAGGIEIKIFSNIHINLPIKEKFSFISHYKLDYKEEDNIYVLLSENEYICDVSVLPLPFFVNETTSTGKSFLSIGQIMNDRLGLYPYSGCKNSNKKSCGFCEIGNFKNFYINTIEDMTELVNFCLKHEFNMKHILISGGTPFNNNWDYFVECLKSIRKITNIPIYQMLEPVDKDLITNLHREGLTEIGFNIEILDRKLAKQIMPEKGLIPLEKYLSCLNYATELWGTTGKVRSILIVGLEPLESTLEAVDILSKMGVLPILSPFRPVQGTTLEHYSPPSAEFLYKTWLEASHITKQNNMLLGPICIACQNNTLSLPFEKEYHYY